MPLLNVFRPKRPNRAASNSANSPFLLRRYPSRVKKRDRDTTQERRVRIAKIE
ncbi:hypothetical protein VTI74DRAFT_2556 [Chaetomium olivicolor]